MRYEVKIPLPQDLLSEGNKTDSFWKKRDRKKRKHFWLATYFRVELIKLPCKVTLTRIAPRELDYDNLVTTGKHFRDWISDKLIPGLQPGRADSDKRIEWEYKQEKGQVREYAIRIEIVSSLPVS